MYLHHTQQLGALHHSSLLAGGKVAAAGEIEIKQGIIKMVNRESGHYHPEELHLNQFLRELRRRGVDVRPINVIRKIEPRK
jgi:hypothetical protein